MRWGRPRGSRPSCSVRRPASLRSVAPTTRWPGTALVARWALTQSTHTAARHAVRAALLVPTGHTLRQGPGQQAPGHEPSNQSRVSATAVRPARSRGRDGTPARSWLQTRLSAPRPAHRTPRRGPPPRRDGTSRLLTASGIPDRGAQTGPFRRLPATVGQIADTSWPLHVERGPSRLQDDHELSKRPTARIRRRQGCSTWNGWSNPPRPPATQPSCVPPLPVGPSSQVLTLPVGRVAGVPSAKSQRHRRLEGPRSPRWGATHEPANARRPRRGAPQQLSQRGRPRTHSPGAAPPRLFLAGQLVDMHIPGGDLSPGPLWIT